MSAGPSRHFIYKAIVIFSVAIGIGATATVFTMARELLWRSPPYPHSERLATIHERDPDGQLLLVALQNFLDFRDRSESFELMAAFRLRSFGLRTNDPSSKTAVIQVGLVTSDFFSTLGIDPASGRSFTFDEELAEEPVIVLAHPLARLPGETVLLNEEARTVVGILPEGFRFPGASASTSPDAYIPLSHRDYGGKRSVRTLNAIGRLREGASLEEAEAELDDVASDLASIYPETNAGHGAALVPLQKALRAGNLRPLSFLAASALSLFAIVLVNLASLFLAQLAGRSREVAVRASLGAGPRDLLGLAFVDSLLPALGGAALGLLLGHWLLGPLPRVLSLLGGSVPSELALGFEAILFAMATAFATAGGLAALVLPLSARANLATLLRTGALAGPSPQRLRRALVVTQVGLAVLLLETSGTLGRSFLNLVSVDPGFETEAGVLFGIGIPETVYDSETKMLAFHQSLLQQLESIPGVESAGAGTGTVLSAGISHRVAFLREGESAPRVEWPSVNARLASPGYFDSLGVPLLRGRGFTWDDDLDSPHVVLVNRVFEQTFFDERGALEARLRLSWQESQFEIVGVVADIRQVALSEPAAPEIILPLAQFPSEGAIYLLRTSRRDPALGSSVRAAVERLDSRLETVNVRPLTFWVDESVRDERLSLVLASVVGTSAFALAAIGIYGILAHSVVTRRRELALRVALGASHGSVRFLVVGEGLKLATFGLALGIAAFAFAAPLLESRLFEVQALDASALVSTIVATAALALLGCFWPSRRATKTAPMEALREE